MDNKVVANNHKYFGTGRFFDPDANRLINVLCHDFEKTGLSGTALGFNDRSDIYTAEEAGDRPYNTDMTIIHVNYAAVPENTVDEICPTLAHEYQHLIAFTECLENPNGNEWDMETWINECMAMTAMELSYPGHCTDSDNVFRYNAATSVKMGKSLYDFDGYKGPNGQDFGNYAQVFLFGQYLEKYMGVEVFKAFHDYWRTDDNQDDKQSEGKGLFAIASEKVKSEVDSTITYLDSVKTKIDTDEFMSKLALCFNIASIKQDSSGKYGISYNKGTRYTSPYIPLLVDINPSLYGDTKANIEGGGRILVKPKDGKYVVPADADPNLIYVGFSKDGKTITLDPTFAVAQYKVTYEDLAAGAVKPASSSALPAEKKCAEGTTVTVEPNLTTTETTYNGKTGTWTFDGWQPKVAGTVTITGTDTKTFTMPGKDVVLVPKWTFTEAPTPTVTAVTVTPASATMEVGTEKTFTATVTGENSPSEEVTWTVEGATSADTKIDANGATGYRSR